MKIKKGDTIAMVKGKDKGKTGKVLKALPKENRVIVEGLNLIKKHQRPRRQGEKGQIITIPRAVSVANVKLTCPKCDQRTRVGYKIIESRKYRLCKKCEASFD